MKYRETIKINNLLFVFFRDDLLGRIEATSHLVSKVLGINFFAFCYFFLFSMGSILV